MHTLRYKFEQLPSHYYTDLSGQQWQAGMIDGEAVIKWHAPDDWYVDAISVEYDNGKYGNAAKSHMLGVLPSNPLFSELLKGLEDGCAEHIADTIQDEIDFLRDDDGRADYLRAAE